LVQEAAKELLGIDYFTRTLRQARPSACALIPIRRLLNHFLVFSNVKLA
jgi:hypothetical protein